MKRILIAVLALGFAAALAAAPQPAGTITTVSGKVSLYSTGEAKGRDLKLGQQVYAGDRLKTGANGRVSLVLVDGTQMKVNYNTEITLNEKDSKGKASERGIGSIKLSLGQLWAKVTKKNSRLEFDTPAAVAAVKGTEPEFDVSPEGDTCIKLREGRLDLSALKGSGLSLSALQQVCMAKGQGLNPGLVKPWDGKGSFTTGFTDATAADVKVGFKDDAGNMQTIFLEYSK